MNQTAQNLSVAQTLMDPDVRQAIRDNPRQYAIERGFIDADSAVEIKLVTSDRGTLHIALMPMPESDNNLSAEQLQNLQAAGNTGTISTMGSYGCVGSVGSSISTASTAGCIGTASTAGD